MKALRRLTKNLRRINFSRFFALIFAAVLAVVFVVPALTQQPVQIRVFMQALEAKQWQPFIEEFEQQNPDINLEVIPAPNDTNLVEDLYTSAFLLGDSPYDLVYMDIVWVPKFAAAGWLKPLGEYISEAELAEFLQGDVNGGTYNGDLYRMPFRSDAGMLYYRTDLLAEAGYENPPETFAELVKMSKDIQQQGLAEWGYVWQGKQYEGLSAMFVEILEGFDGFWVNPETLEVGLDSPNAIDAIAFLRDTIESGISPQGVTTYAEEETRRLFQNGNTAFLRNWPYVYSLASESEIAGDFAIKPMVHTPGASSGACLGGWGLGISQSSPHPNEAWRVIQFFSSRETQKQYSLAYGYAPSREDLYTDPEVVAEYSYFPELLAIVKSSALRPPIAQYAQVSDILQRYLSAALTDRMTPEEAMEAAAKETRQVLGRT